MTIVGGAGETLCACVHASSDRSEQLRELSEMDSLNHLLILIFVCFQLWNGLASFSAHHECQLEYRVEYGNGQIVINPQWKTESCREEEVI